MKQNDLRAKDGKENLNANVAANNIPPPAASFINAAPPGLVNSLGNVALPVINRNALTTPSPSSSSSSASSAASSASPSASRVNSGFSPTPLSPFSVHLAASALTEIHNRHETPSPNLVRMSNNNGQSPIAAGAGSLFSFKVQSIHQIAEIKRAYPFDFKDKTQRRMLREIEGATSQFGRPGIFLEAYRGASTGLWSSSDSGSGSYDHHQRDIVSLMNVSYMSSDGHLPEDDEE